MLGEGLIWLCSSLAAANGFLVTPKAVLSRRPATLTQRQPQPQPRQLRLSTASSEAAGIDAGSPPVSASESDGLVIGLNKYSHDSSVCILSSR